MHGSANLKKKDHGGYFVFMNTCLHFCISQIYKLQQCGVISIRFRKKKKFNYEILFDFNIRLSFLFIEMRERERERERESHNSNLILLKTTAIFAIYFNVLILINVFITFQTPAAHCRINFLAQRGLYCWETLSKFHCKGGLVTVTPIFA